MAANTFVERTKPKLKFLVAYLISVVLIVLIFASFTKNTDPAAADTSGEADGESTKLSVADGILHHRLNELNQLYLTAATDSTKTESSAAAIQSASMSFQLLLDSLQNETAGLSSEQQKQDWLLMLANFKTEMQGQSLLYNRFSSAASQSVLQTTGSNQKLLQDQKAALEEKDRTIIALQQQLRQALVTASPTSTNDAELKRKFADLKAANEKLSSENVMMKRSYQLIADDNKRLLSQLQSLRKE